MHNTKHSSLRAGYFALILVAVAMSAAAATKLAFGPRTDRVGSAQIASLAMLATALVSATYFDVTRLRIPNAVTYATIAVAIGSNAAASLIPRALETAPFTALGAVGLAQSLLGALTGFGVMAVVFALSGRGAGDVKLATAIGATLGPAETALTIVWTHLLAGAFAICWIVISIGPLNLVSLAASSIGLTCAPPSAADTVRAGRRALNRPVALAGFFALGAIFSIAGVGQ